MDRRILLAGLASLATGSAFAQSTPPPATDAPAAPAPAPKPEAAPAEAPAMKIAPPVGGSVSQAVSDHITRTTAAGSLSLALSRLAATKAKAAPVKQFAGFETAEQETVADILKARAMPDLQPSGAVKPPTDAELAGKIDRPGQDLLERMRAMKAGRDFDQAYVKAQRDGHKILLAIQEDYLKTADDRELTTLAKLARGMIKEHLALLEEIDKRTG